MNKNEALLKMRDPKFYLENFCKIKVKKGGLAPFILNKTQKDLFNTLNNHNRVMLLKARQLGSSTGVTGYFYHNTIMNTGITTALIGYNMTMVAELLDKVKVLYNSTPLKLRPTLQYNSKYELSFPSIESKILVLPNSENVGRGYTINNCLSGDNFVFLANGKTTRVKDLIDGEIIINGNGGKSKIKKVFKLKNKKRMISIKGNGMETNIKVTEDHKILSRNSKNYLAEWKEAKDFKIGDYVAFPYFQVRERFANKEIIIGDYIKKGYKSRSNNIINKIKINYDFGLFIGWYLAEGSSLKNTKRNDENVLCFSIDMDEEEMVVNIVKKVWDGKISILKNKNSRTKIIKIYNSNFTRFIKENFGCGNNKFIDDKIWYWGRNFVDGLIFGIFSGDGYFKNDRIVQLTNTNYGIVNQIRKLLVSRRIGFANFYKNKSYRYGKRGRDRYDLRLTGKGNFKFRRKFKIQMPIYNNGRFRWLRENVPGANYGHNSWRKGKFYYWSKIEKIQEIQNEEYVYDISLEKSPYSFLTTGGVVHNCLVTELSSWEKAEEKMMGLQESVSADGKIVIESTPRGSGNLYHRMWMTKNEYIKKEYGWWWGYSESEMEAKKISMGPMAFAQEYGLEFLSSGRSVFDPMIIRKQRKNILKVGDERIINEEKFIVYEKDGWVIYKEPEVGGLYVIGGDVSEGVAGGDYSVAIIWDRKTGEEVAMYRGLIAPDRFGEILNKKGREYNNALMVVEVNNHGLTTLTILKQKLYPSMYFRPAKYETVAASTSDRMGWRTTKITRPLLIDDFAQAIREELLTIHSKILLDEMSVFIYNDSGDMVSQAGFNNDTIFGAGIGFQGFKILYDKPLTQLDEKDYLPKHFAY